MKREECVVGQSWAHLELGRAYFTMDHLDMSHAQFELAVLDGLTIDASTIRYGRVGVEACRLMRGVGGPEPLAAVVADLLELGCSTRAPRV